MKKLILWGMIIVLMQILTGCWDMQDITNRAYITSIGLDHATNREGADYRVTFEIVLPERMRGQGTQNNAFLIQTVESSSIGTAMEKLQARISRPLSLSHIRVVLLGEEFAKHKNFLDMADYFQRNPNVQMRIQLMIVQNAEAKDILELKPIYDDYIAKELIRMTQIDTPQTTANSFFDFTSQLRSHAGNGLITRTLASEEDKMIIRHGVGVYDNWRLRGWLTSEETRNANWLMDAEQFIIDANNGRGTYTYMVDYKSVKIIPVQKNGTLAFQVNLKTTGELMQEQGEHIDATDPAVLQELSKLFAKTIKGQVEAAITKAQNDFRLDYLGFDDALNQTGNLKYDPQEWKKVFPTVPVTVEVEAKVVRFGLGK